MFPRKSSIFGVPISRNFWLCLIWKNIVFDKSLTLSSQPKLKRNFFVSNFFTSNSFSELLKICKQTFILMVIKCKYFKSLKNQSDSPTSHRSKWFLTSSPKFSNSHCEKCGVNSEFVVLKITTKRTNEEMALPFRRSILIRFNRTLQQHSLPGRRHTTSLPSGLLSLLNRKGDERMWLSLTNWKAYVCVRCKTLLSSSLVATTHYSFRLSRQFSFQDFQDLRGPFSHIWLLHIRIPNLTGFKINNRYFFVTRRNQHSSIQRPLRISTHKRRP